MSINYVLECLTCNTRSDYPRNHAPDEMFTIWKHRVAILELDGVLPESFLPNIDREFLSTHHDHVVRVSDENLRYCGRLFICKNCNQLHYCDQLDNHEHASDEEHRPSLHGPASCPQHG